MGQQDFNQNEMDKIQEIQKKNLENEDLSNRSEDEKNKIWKLE